MRVIFDECLPRRLGLELSGHLVSTVPQADWAGIANGKLLACIQGNYDAFITIDKNLSNKRLTGFPLEWLCCGHHPTSSKT